MPIEIKRGKVRLRAELSDRYYDIYRSDSTSPVLTGIDLEDLDGELEDLASKLTTPGIMLEDYRSWSSGKLLAVAGDDVLVAYQYDCWYVYHVQAQALSFSTASRAEVEQYVCADLSEIEP